MTDFLAALNVVLKNEGGYVSDPDDPGGETYKGIARKINSKWDGWVIIDLMKKEPSFPANLDNNTELQEKIKDFYRINFWDRISGDNIADQQVATSIFDFAVNAGVSSSVTLAQIATGINADGVMSKDSVDAVNKMEVEFFLASFTIAKIARYIRIVRNRPDSRKYFFGWVCRALGE